MRASHRPLWILVCLCVGILGMPGQFLAGRQASAATGDPRIATCVAGAFPGTVPLDPVTNPVAFSASCVVTTTDPVSFPVVDVDYVSFRYTFDKPINRWHSSEDIWIPSTNSPNAGRFVGSRTDPVNVQYPGASVTGAQCYLGAHLVGGPWVPCSLIWVDDPGTTGWCSLYGQVHGVNDPTCVSDPVNPVNGAYSTSATDVAFASSGLPLSLVRSYDSSDQVRSMFGPGWTSNLDTRLFAGELIGSSLPTNLGQIRSDRQVTGQVFIAPPDLPFPDDPALSSLARTPPVEDELSPAQSIPPRAQVVLRTEGGGRMAFSPLADGTYSAPAGVTDKLVRTQSGFSLTRRDQSVYRFDDRGHLLSLADRNGRGIILTWGGGKITSAVDVAGHRIDFTYQAGLLVAATLSDGRSIAYGYDPSGRLSRVTDVRGLVTRYVYTPSSLLDQIIDPENHTIVDNTYDRRGRVISQAGARGFGGSFEYSWNETDYTDAQGHAWRYVLAGSLIYQLIDPLGGTTTYGRNGNMDLTSVTDPNGHTTAFAYDSAHNLTDITRVGTNIHMHMTYTPTNDPETITDPKGHVTRYGYTRGNLTSIDRPGSADVTLTRDADTGLVSSITDPNERTTLLSYNARGERTAVTSPGGQETTFAYYPSGMLKTVTDPRGNLPGANPADFTRHFTYNEADQITSVRDPLGGVSRLAYTDAGNLASTTDANGNLTSYSYFEDNTLRQVLAPEGSSTDFAYDRARNLISRTDASSHVTTYAYDAANRVSSMTLPLGQVWSYGYDAAGNLQTMLDPNGVTTTRRYDGADRLISIDYSDATPDVGFSYDADSNRTAMTDGLGTENYSYDVFDRLIQVARGSDIFSYSYDPAGNVTERIYPDGTTTAYAYNANGQMISATVGSRLTTYGYNAAGMLERVSLPNGITQDAYFDADGRVTALTAESPSGQVASFSYTFDPVGNPLTQVASFQGGAPSTTAYGYDAANRLTDECADVCPNPDSFTRYSYDPVGNRTAVENPEGTTAYQYDANDELTFLDGSGGPETFEYDANGNQTLDNRFGMTYDAAGNRLARIGWGLPRQTKYRSVYSYDGLGNRLETHLSTSTGYNRVTHATWDKNYGLPQLATEAVDNALPTDYIYGMGRIGEQIPGAGEHYYTSDRMGSVTTLSDASGALEATYSYDAFGQMSRTSVSDTPNPFAFTGEYFDQAEGGPAMAGLYNLRARQYDPTTGRFLQRDPIPSVGSAYAYVGNRPTVAVDPSGMCGFWLRFLGGAATCTGDILAEVAVAAGAEHFECGTAQTPATCVVSSQIVHGEFGYTVGDYVFLSNDYKDYPLGGGECLIAHELTHVRQQREAGGFWPIAIGEFVTRDYSSMEDQAYAIGDLCVTMGSRTVVDK